MRKNLPANLLFRVAILTAVTILLASSHAHAQTVVGTLTRPGLVPRAVAVYEAGNRVFVADNSTGNV